jgi:quercetin dioxygenase-like cupin family protein
MPEHETPRPNIVELAEGVSIIDDVLAVAGVDTLEGRVGPLLFGETGRAHYLDMPAGSYVDEHAHDDEAFTLTIRGSYVLCADGERKLMKPGSFFWFGAGTPTGYEVPFDEPAYILVFRGVVEQTPAEMLESLDVAKGRFVEMQQEGVPFALSDLPADHPALLFAHEVNPEAY